MEFPIDQSNENDLGEEENRREVLETNGKGWLRKWKGLETKKGWLLRNYYFLYRLVGLNGYIRASFLWVFPIYFSISRFIVLGIIAATFGGIGYFIWLFYKIVMVYNDDELSGSFSGSYKPSGGYKPFRPKG